MAEDIVGQSITRLEDSRFLTGTAKFTADFYKEGQLHGAILRSPFAHAAIKKIDFEAAMKAAGVIGVYTHDDLAVDGIGPMPCAAVSAVQTLEPIVVPPRPALANGRVRHVGDPVAFVVAESPAAALDALDLIDVDYEEHTALIIVSDALADGAPQLWEEAPGNLCFRFEKGDEAGTEAAIADAPHVVEMEIQNNRVSPAPTEPRAAIGTYDESSDCLHLLVTGQGVHGIRNQLANSIFKIALDKLHVSAPDVGGGFGLKNFVYPEWVLLLWAARKLRRPIKWVAERNEEFMSSIQGRDVQATARLALDGNGRFLALSADLTANMGAYLSAFGPGIATNSASTAISGIYDIPKIFMGVTGAFTNTVPIDAYRGAGKPEANYIVERLIEAAARKIDMDPVDLRLKNVIQKFPHTNAMGMEIDTGDFRGNIEKAVQLADRTGFEVRRTEAAKNGRLRGMGIACFIETSRGANAEGAAVNFRDDNIVELRLGTESNGQGHETAFSQIAADKFGLPLESFHYVQANTAKIQAGNGHGGARSMHMGGSALYAAMEAVLNKARPIAAQMLQKGEDAIVFTEGEFRVRNTGQSVGLLDVAAAAKDPKISGSGGLDSYERREDAPFTFPSGCHVAEVEIDQYTGQLQLVRYLLVDDYGRQINPKLTEGQVHGGVVQGIGQAILENVIYDPNSGQLLNGTWMDYAMPRADQVPPFEIYFRQTLTSANPLGVKGAGQAGCMAAPQTIMSAVLDALKPLEIMDLDMPVTPERLWRAIRKAL